MGAALLQAMLLGCSSKGGDGGAGGSAGSGGGVPLAPWDAGYSALAGWHNVVVGGGGFISGIVTHPSAPGLTYLRTDIGGAYRSDTNQQGWTPITDSLVRSQADSMGILSVAVDSANADRVYLMTGKYTQSWAGPGAILISNDRGSTWSSVALTVKVGGNEDGRGTGERLQVDPRLSARLLMGTTRDGLWQSSDSAKTWTKVGSFIPTNVNFVWFDEPASQARAGADTDGGTAADGDASALIDGAVLTEGGAAVDANVALEGGAAVDAGEAPGRSGGSSRMLVGVADLMQSLWITQDGGATWVPVPGQPTGVMALRAVQSGTAVYLTYANAVGPNNATKGALWKLDIETLAWSQLPVPTGAYGFAGVSVDAHDPAHLVASTLDRWAQVDDVFQSRDSGMTWAPVLSKATFDRSFAPYTATSAPHWITDVKLDPENSDRLLFVTGYGLWDCHDLSAPAATCAFQDRGIEETVAMQIVAPPGVPLLSAMGDIDGFRHDRVDTSPAAGRYKPLRGSTLSIAYAEATPLTVVKAYEAKPYGSYSRDGGATWTAFETVPNGVKAGGARTMTISADGQTVVWSPTGLGAFYSRDMGGSWQASGGDMRAGLPPVADRNDANKFYAFDGLRGDLFVSTDQGASFSIAQSGLASLPNYLVDDASIASVFGHAGHLWLTVGSKGLYRSTDAGTTITPVTGVGSAFRLGFGMAKPGLAYPALYLFGTIGDSTGVFRSDDEGQSWTELTDAAHKFGVLHDITGDPQTYGTVFIGTEGRGIQYFRP